MPAPPPPPTGLLNMILGLLLSSEVQYWALLAEAVSFSQAKGSVRFRAAPDFCSSVELSKCCFAKLKVPY